MPDEAKAYIDERKDKTPGQLFRDLNISTQGRGIYYTQKQVHNYWTEANSSMWRLDRSDELNSAAMVLERHADDNVERIDLPEERGVKAFAFVLKDSLESRGRFLNEIAMDSPCEFMRTIP